MKKQAFIILVLIISQFTFAQDNEIDELFENQSNLNKEIVNVLESSYREDWNFYDEEYEVPSSRSLFSYDEFANRTQNAFDLKDDEGNWVSYLKFNYFYTDDNIRFKRIRQNWDSDINEYVNKTQYLYYYNDDGLLIDVQTYNWNTESSEWDLHNRDMASYNAANELIERIVEIWNSELETWNLSSRYLYDYEDGNRIRKSFYFWAEDVEEWDPYSKYEYVYTDDNFRYEDYYYKWELGEWIANRKYEYFRDDAGYIQHYLGFAWDEDTSEWIHTHRQIHNWMSISLGINTLSNNLFSINPNPVSDYLYIDSTTDSLLNLSIYNSLGQLVLQNNTMQASINVMTLHKGIYFLKIIENDSNSSQLIRFVKN